MTSYISLDFLQKFIESWSLVFSLDLVTTSFKCMMVSVWPELQEKIYFWVWDTLDKSKTQIQFSVGISVRWWSILPKYFMIVRNHPVKGNVEQELQKYHQTSTYLILSQIQWYKSSCSKNILKIQIKSSVVSKPSFCNSK